MPQRIITGAEFDRMIKEENSKLVLLDDMVIDISKFINKHPGGKFMLEQNIGRDISKYFYGGYALEGNLKRNKNPPTGHNHSNYARKIISDLAIARIELTKEAGPQIEPGEMFISANNYETTRQVNNITRTFTL